MMNYLQVFKPASWILLVLTLLFAFLICFAVGVVSGMLIWIQWLMVPDEHPWRFDKTLWLCDSGPATGVAFGAFLFRHSDSYAVIPLRNHRLDCVRSVSCCFDIPPHFLHAFLHARHHPALRDTDTGPHVTFQRRRIRDFALPAHPMPAPATAPCS